MRRFHDEHAVGVDKLQIRRVKVALQKDVRDTVGDVADDAHDFDRMGPIGWLVLAVIVVVVAVLVFVVVRRRRRGGGVIATRGKR